MRMSCCCNWIEEREKVEHIRQTDGQTDRTMLDQILPKEKSEKGLILAKLGN